MRIHVLLLVLPATACSGAASVDTSQSTASLTPAQQAQFCSDTFGVMQSRFSAEDRATVSCGIAPTNDIPENCPESFNACVVQQTAALSAPTAPDCTTFAAQAAACNTTVDKYQKCFAQELDAVKAFEGKVPICSQGATADAIHDSFSNLSSDCVNLAVTCTMTFVPWGP